MSARTWMRSKARRLMPAVVVTVMLAAGSAALGVTAASPALASLGCGGQSGVQPLLAGGSWLGGTGVDVQPNGNDQGASSGNSCGGSTQSYVNGANAGYEWQCVELVNRLYLTKGWITSHWYGNGDTLASNLPTGFTAEPQNSITSIVPGDVVTLSNSGAGHAGIVNTVTSNGDGTYTVQIVNQNDGTVGSPVVESNVTWNPSAGTLSSEISGDTTQDVIHAPGNTNSGGVSASPNPLHSGNASNGSPIVMPGRWWSGDTGQDFAYAEEVTNSSGSDIGFSVGIMEQTSSGLVGHDSGFTSVNQGLTFENTIFIPADANGDGLMDLYYVTSSNWNSNGFAVGLMLNNGNGFTYEGTVWNPTNISLANTKFVPGHFVSGTTGDGFAYITKSSDGGWATGVMVPNQTNISNPMTWEGDWWDDSGTSGVTFANTEFFGSDPNGDGLTDLYYATSSNWGANGFAVGVQMNSGSSFSWGGTQWSPSNLALSNIKFLPGYWQGGSDEELAYVSRNTSDSSFSVGVLAPNPGNLMTWEGDWWDQPASNGTFYQTAFIPADTNNDGYTDLFYAESSNWYSNGFAVGLMHNTGSALSWSGTAWAPTNIQLAATQFVPQA